MIVNVGGFWDPLIEQFSRMTGEGFLHKSFFGNHFDLPVRFVNSVAEVIPTRRATAATLPRRKLDEPADARLRGI
jgi:hypothetical protein